MQNYTPTFPKEIDEGYVSQTVFQRSFWLINIALIEAFSKKKDIILKIAISSLRTQSSGPK